MSVLDGLLDFLTLKAKPARKDESNEDEYIIPVLSVSDFQMTDALIRRRQSEELRKRYGLMASKEGEFI